MSTYEERTELLRKIKNGEGRPPARERVRLALVALAKKSNEKYTCHESKTVGSRERTPLINVTAKNGNDGT